MTATVELNIVIAAALGFLAVLCAVASVALRRNAPLAWLSAALAVGLAAVATLALLRPARLSLLVWYFGPEIDFTGFNSSSTELALRGIESAFTLAIVTLVISVIVADTIATFRHQPERDGLTGLLNRRALDALAALPISRGGAVIFCDIDHFKLVNDRFGHQVGDDVICSFGHIIGRTGYPAGRFGGEEFVVILPERSLQEATDLAEMMRARFASSAHQGMPASERVTASFGIADIAAGAAPDSAFARADAALYMAKNSGRNRVVRTNAADPLPERPRRARDAA